MKKLKKRLKNLVTSWEIILNSFEFWSIYIFDIWQRFTGLDISYVNLCSVIRLKVVIVNWLLATLVPNCSIHITPPFIGSHCDCIVTMLFCVVYVILHVFVIWFIICPCIVWLFITFTKEVCISHLNPVPTNWHDHEIWFRLVRCSSSSIICQLRKRSQVESMVWDAHSMS